MTFSWIFANAFNYRSLIVTFCTSSILRCSGIHSTIPAPTETVCPPWRYHIYWSRRTLDTVLGPLLFLVFINGIQESTNHSGARLCAGDCLLYRHMQSSRDSGLLQEDLSALVRWEETWQMKFHPEIYNDIRIGTSRRQIIKTTGQIPGHTLEVADSNKNLGVTISEDLTRRKHIESTINRANRTLGFISRNHSDCSAPVKSAAYTTLVRLSLEYSTVWDPHLTTNIHSLEQVQRRGIQICALWLHSTMCLEYGPEPWMGDPST